MKGGCRGRLELREKERRKKKSSGEKKEFLENSPEPEIARVRRNRE